MEKLMQRFVEIVVIVLCVLMGVVVVLAVVELGWLIVREVIASPVGLLETPKVFDIFQYFLMVLIAVELFESIRAYVTQHVLRVELLLLAALMAVARKVIVLNFVETPPLALIGLSALAIAFAGGYFLIRRFRRK